MAEEIGIDGLLRGRASRDKAGHMKRLQGRPPGRHDWVMASTTSPSARPGGCRDRHRQARMRARLASFSPPTTPLRPVRRRALEPRGHRKMKQNLVGGRVQPRGCRSRQVLAPWGFIMPMSVGAILMSLSTVIVALNASSCGRSISARSRPRLWRCRA